MVVVFFLVIIRKPTSLSHSGFCSAPTLDPQKWPKYAPFIFPKGLGSFLGEIICRIFGGQDWPFWGHAHLQPKRPKTGANGPKRGKGQPCTGTRRVKTRPKWLNIHTYVHLPKVSRVIFGRNHFDHFRAQTWPFGVRVQFFNASPLEHLWYSLVPPSIGVINCGHTHRFIASPAVG